MKLLYMLLAITGVAMVILFRQSMPVETPTEWKHHTLEKYGISFSSPPDMNVKSEEKEDETFSFYIERSALGESDFYQLYGLYNFFNTSNFDTSIVKSEMRENTISESKISGYTVIEGKYNDDRNILYTVIVTDKGLLTLATAQPSTENIRLTHEILETLQIQ
jgi:hypothetical protein